MVEKRRVWLATLMKGGTLGIVLIGVLAVGCLTRPVVSQSPTTKTSFATQVKQQSIDKIDMLFAIDNSASMGDKQDLLAAAVPVLVNRLLSPNCVDTGGTVCKTAADCSALGAGAGCDLSSGTGQCYVASTGGQCGGNTKLEFPAVHDLHIGIVTSSLGGGGSPDICVPAQGDPLHQNDAGHLINRSKVANCTTPTSTGCDGPAIQNAKPLDGSGGNFLAWLPSSNPLNAGKTPPNVTIYNDGQQTQLISDFKALVQGVQERGCGLEAQLESWYRFLIQPDPYNAIVLGSGGVPPAQLQDVDATLLKMRHDFLRPDSLVAVIQLTDEEDSWSDPLWGGGYGWTTRTLNFPGGPGSGMGPRGTTECDAPVNVNDVANTGPNNPDCTSCAFSGNKPVSGSPIASDPNCTSCAGGASSCPQKGWYTTQQDGVNVRYTDDMKRRYGLNPQWNVQRYIDGLRLPKAPDRDNEAHDLTAYGNTNRNCTNPLYAQNLPDGSDTSHDTLCNLSPGSRTPDLVFYAIIGGVPNSLLYNSQGNFKLNLGPDDWTKILGKDPSTYQLDGIDTHMLESIAPRAGLTAPTGTYTPDTDTSEHEWNTLKSSAGIDMQYACTFQLPQAKDCTSAQFMGACDCATSTGTVITDADGPPLCDAANRQMQIRGKAYPTIRELRVAKGLGSQAVVASLCAKDTNPADSALPDYGYNPAMQAIVNRLKNVLGGQCLPETLAVDTTTGQVPCTVLVIYTSQTNQSAGCTDPGLSQPDAPTLARFAAQWQALQGDAGTSAPVPVVCVLNQLTAADYAPAQSCETVASAPPGWCYVIGVGNTGGCPQAIKFSPQGQPKSGTTISLECIEQRGAGDAGGGG